LLFQFLELKSEFKLANCILIVPMCSFQRITESLRRVSQLEGSLGSLKFYGGHKAVVRPDPIPNSAVKHSVADGSGFIDSARVGSRHSLLEKAETNVSAFLCPPLKPADCRQTPDRHVNPAHTEQPGDKASIDGCGLDWLESSRRGKAKISASIQVALRLSCAVRVNIFVFASK
jgi:hypothetical protein